MPLGNLAQSAKRLINGFGSPKDSRHVGIEDDNVGPLPVSLGVLAALRSAEVVLRKHFSTLFAVSSLFHNSFAPPEWLAGR